MKGISSLADNLSKKMKQTLEDNEMNGEDSVINFSLFNKSQDYLNSCLSNLQKMVSDGNLGSADGTQPKSRSFTTKFESMEDMQEFLCTQIRT